MENKKILTGKLYKLVELLAWEMEKAWDYGAGFPLHHSEVHLLDAIKEHEGAKASELAGYMNITSGAVSQATKKLLNKELVEDYKQSGNRKEVFFRLTPLGERVYRGHQKHHNKINGDFFDYVENLSEKDLQVICNFFDVIINSFERLKEK
jgi:DNA-binding MarR family transcriptional regulator